ncbi:MAG TPA: heme-binding protein [Chitinophaga sp.]
MTAPLNRFGMGARFVPADLLTEVDLGPLKQLVGEWESVPLTTTDAQGVVQPLAAGWNVISVPGGDNFVFEVIPYRENLKFSAVAVQAGNRGPVLNGTQFDQEIFGLFYEQQIVSVCNTEFCNSRGFSDGTVIHAETGLFLYITNYNGGFTIARLGTVPHGNALLALGASTETSDPGTNFFPSISAKGVNLDGSALAMFGYNDQIIGNPQFKDFNQVDPNIFLQSTLATIVGSGSITSMTTLDMSTQNPDATGGILNIPFIQSNVTATTMDATFWLENISGGSETELLQYSQTINLMFPPVGTVTPIIWPHITISTLRRMPSAVTATKEPGSEGVPQL